MLVDAGLPDSMWPLALRHAAERRLQLQMADVKMPTQELLPFGSYGYARQKDWNEKTRAWKRSRVKVRILGPDTTITSGGYYVQTEDGYYLHTTDVRLWKDPESLERVKEMPNLGELWEKGKKGPVEQDPVRRVHGKTPAMVKRLMGTLEELEARFERGRAVMVEEALLRERCQPEGLSEGGALLDAVIVENEGIEASLKQIQEAVTEAAVVACEESGEWLQTVTIPNAEVRKEMDLWRPAFEKEFKSLVDTGVIEVIQEAELRGLEQKAKEAGRIFEVVPGKAVCTRKSPDGRRKARGVICGNYMMPREKEDLYASGCDITAIRSMIRHAALQGWSLATVDVSTAFLQVPPGQKKDTTVVIPPKLFREAGLATLDDRWLVRGTLYGTITAPREWGDHRDETLRALRWGENQEWSLGVTMEPHLWKVMKGGEVMGHAAIYVDDVLVSGSVDTVSLLLKTLEATWKCSAPEWVGTTPVKFCGLEISAEHGGYKIHQESYIRSLLAKHGVEKKVGQLRYEPPVEEQDRPLEVVRRAQAITGELQWASSRTRPDLAYPCGIMAQYATKAPAQVVAIGLEVLRYLSGSATAGILYGPGADGELVEGLPFKRERSVVEIQCDAAYAPGGGKSVTGLVAFYAGAPVFWASTRQSVMALSTAEAELSAQLDALVAGRSMRALIRCVEGVELQGIILNDNVAALSIASGTSGSWRTRHLRIKAEALTEAVRNGEWSLRHLDGKCLVADGLTKQLTGRTLEKFVKGLGMRDEEEKEVVAVRTLRSGSVECERVSKLLAAVIGLGCCVQGVEATEDEELREGVWLALALVVLSMGYVLGECIKKVGRECVRRWFGDPEEMKVKMLSMAATVPVRGTEYAAGWDLAAAEEATVEAGESRVISTGLALELPRGAYGRLTGRSSYMVRNIMVGPGVIDRDYRGEVKVVLMNGSREPLHVKVGDRVAQLIVERIYEGGLRVVEELSETGRGGGGFGSTGRAQPQLRVLRGEVRDEVVQTEYELPGEEPVSELEWEEGAVPSDYSEPYGLGMSGSEQGDQGLESRTGGVPSTFLGPPGEFVVDWAVRGWRTPHGRSVHMKWTCTALQNGSSCRAIRLCRYCFPDGRGWPPDQIRCAAYPGGDVAHTIRGGCLPAGAALRPCRICTGG